MRAPVRINEMRTLVRALSKEGKISFTNAHVYEAQQLSGIKEKDRCRRCLNDLVARKEIKRVDTGRYEYLPENRPHRTGESFSKMWRAIRNYKGAWSYYELAAVSHVHVTAVNKYSRWLARKGYVRASGRKGRCTAWIVTTSGRAMARTPYPPMPMKDAYARERTAMTNLCRIFFEKDLTSEEFREEIVKSCLVLLKRFKPEEKANDQ
ncbi:MAG: hypothetical protein ACNI27_07005 [Desulfovibrio sp.]